MTSIVTGSNTGDPYTLLSLSEREEHAYGRLQPSTEYQNIEDRQRDGI